MQGSQEGKRAKLLSQPANFGENISMKVLFSTCRRADKLHEDPQDLEICEVGHLK